MSDVKERSDPADALKHELLGRSRRLEQRLQGLPVTTVLVTFQYREHLTAATRDHDAALARGGAQVLAFARGLIPDDRPDSWELRTVALTSGDALVSEWDIVVIGPQLAEAFVARDLDPAVTVTGKDLDRAFSWTSTNDPELVHAAAESLLSRVPAAPR